MRVSRLREFEMGYARLPMSIRKKVDRQIGYLIQDIRHPGAHAKKMESVGDIWEARIDRHYRMTFEIIGDVILFRRVGTHAVLKTP